MLRNFGPGVHLGSQLNPTKKMERFNLPDEIIEHIVIFGDPHPINQLINESWVDTIDRTTVRDFSTREGTITFFENKSPSIEYCLAALRIRLQFEATYPYMEVKNLIFYDYIRNHVQFRLVYQDDEGKQDSILYSKCEVTKRFKIHALNV